MAIIDNNGVGGKADNFSHKDSLIEIMINIIKITPPYF